MSQDTARPTTPSFLKGPYFWILVGIVVALSLTPLADATETGHNISEAIFYALLIGSFFAAAEGKRVTKFVVGLLVIRLVLWGVASAIGGNELVAGGQLPGVALLLLVIAVMIQFILRARRVTSDLIYASICAYMFLGLLWAFLYRFLYLYAPNVAHLRGPAEFIPENTGPAMDVLVYFSYVTMSTLGYGDMSPITEPARVLVILEAITGQLFIAVLIARIVGIHIAQETMPSSPEK
ncbi:MAG: ion channel [Planctomycetota bacterium]|jgi:hypothetical protein